MSTYIIDTETTGAEQPEVIELAIGKVERNLEFLPVFEGRFLPTGRILHSAMAVHHILPEELVGLPSSALAKAELPTDMEYMIGHKVDYDWDALGRPACKRICTLAISQRIWPGNDGHSLSALTYALSSDKSLARDMLKSAHGAGADVELVYNVLRAMLEQESMKHLSDFEQLWLFSEDARIPRIWTFGKHKGQDIAQTDQGYLLWCLRQDFIEEYVKTACRLALKGELR